MTNRCCRLLFLLTLLNICSLLSYGQVQLIPDEEKPRIEIDFFYPKKYEIGGITYTGVANFDTRLLLFQVGDVIEIPGEQISKSIKNIWKSGLYEDIDITLTRVVDNLAFINIQLTERNRLVAFGFKGIRKGQETDLRDKIKLAQGNIVNENMVQTCVNVIKKYYIEKGYYNCGVKPEIKPDDKINKGVTIVFDIDKGRKVKIDRILVSGVSIPQGRLTKVMKGTKERTRFEPMSKADTMFRFMVKHMDYYKSKDLLEHLGDYFSDRVKFRIAKSSKFNKDDYENDKVSLINKMNDYGFRDAYINFDTVIFENSFAYVLIDVNEGNKYYFRNIDLVGNTKYPTKLLKEILNIEKGDVYNQSLLEEKLQMDKNGNDLSSLYMNDGYLFFRANPVEVRVEGDSIDLEIRIFEGKQATNNKITVSGNTKTSDRVILRELTTIPGQLFNREDLINSQRLLLGLGYFNQESINVIPKPNETEGIVDLEYVVEEASSDQLELQVGAGATGFMLTAGIAFNNFSFKKIFKKDAWNPIPAGDGQKLAFRASSSLNRTYVYQYYTASFTEPWVGGKRPNSLTAGISYQVQSTGNRKDEFNYHSMRIFGVSVGYEKKLQWPDNFFRMMHTLMYQHYNVHNFTSELAFATGNSNTISYIFTLVRNSVDAIIYPRAGSEIMFSAQLTPPYSLFSNKDYSTATLQEKYRWIELHKWKFNISWFTRIVENLVVNIRFKSGFMGCYNKAIGISPFERFYMGGDGLGNYSYIWSEMIPMRGYGDKDLSPQDGASIFNKFTAELRYPITLNPSATIYLLGFAEAGNSWIDKRAYSPFKFYKSAGFGVRIFLPMFGLLGFDWGYGFDEVPGKPGANKSHFHISINSSID
ncbi:MAG: BamA/TamA family outer membrane protein [Bacteroidetes bacterium]|nr:BamA/TamA family outer membrane protein [Bacteroidota bacterium]MCL1968811.1 BamA/TamA family outer membrane protein [Bacteroidota bacterium]